MELYNQDPTLDLYILYIWEEVSLGAGDEHVPYNVY